MFLLKCQYSNSFSNPWFLKFTFFNVRFFNPQLREVLSQNDSGQNGPQWSSFVFNFSGSKWTRNLTFLDINRPDWKNCSYKAYCCPRDYSLSSRGPFILPPWNPSNNIHGTMVSCAVAVRWKQDKNVKEAREETKGKSGRVQWER